MASESDMLEEANCSRFDNDKLRNKMYGVFIHLGRCVFTIGIMLVLVTLTVGTDTDDEDGNINFIITVLGVVFIILGECFWIFDTLLHDGNLLKDYPESKPFLD